MEVIPNNDAVASTTIVDVNRNKENNDDIIVTINSTAFYCLCRTVLGRLFVVEENGESFSTQRDGGKPKEGNRESPQIERER
jgi:hypothetical protein